ncbi:MAG: hypothetical protein ACREM3_19605 [Candidatus Rokuibacteriota bacterium]
MIRRGARLLVLVTCVGAASGCATLRELAHDVPARVHAATKPVKYVLAGADPDRRDSLDRGQAQIKAGEYRLALRSLRQALWDAERIDARWLRLEELAETYHSLAAVYAGLRNNAWAEEHRTVAAALADYPGPAGPPASPDGALTLGRSAYRAARFRDATVALGRALIDLEGISHTPARVAAVEEARCYLILARFALDQDERAREEVRRLAALDDSLASCRRQAPPVVQAFIRSVQTSDAPAARRAP